MNCPFCQAQVFYKAGATACHGCNATLMWDSEIKKIFCATFIALYNDKVYCIEYYPEFNNTYIMLRGGEHFKVPGIPITPQNVKSRLPTILLFS